MRGRGGPAEEGGFAEGGCRGAGGVRWLGAGAGAGELFGVLSPQDKCPEERPGALRRADGAWAQREACLPACRPLLSRCRVCPSRAGRTDAAPGNR